MAIEIGQRHYSVADVVAVARHGEKVFLGEDAVTRITQCREFLEERVGSKEIIYGTNTGIGEFSEIVLEDAQLEDFQRYLVYNHAAGVGEPAPIEHIRAAMFLRVLVQSKGFSGCRLELTQCLVDMLNQGVCPVVCERGSVGACGDLAPLSQVALVLLGEGEAFYKGERLGGGEAMRRAGIKPCGLKVRDGLAVINGASVSAGIGALLVHDTGEWIRQAEIAAAMSLEALKANLMPYEARIVELRGFAGAVDCSWNLRAMMQGSDLHDKVKPRVQDAYTMRSTPQVIGTLRDHWRWCEEQMITEINGVCDNPVFDAEAKRIYTGANFQGSPFSMPLDNLGAGITMVSVLSERRLNRLLNPALNGGLPAFLAKNPGYNSGFMLSQYTADAQIVEQKILSQPAFIQSIPAAADQEDFVSMSMNSALKTAQILKLAQSIIGIELLAATQGVELRGFTPGKGTKAAMQVVRKHVPLLDVDRPLHIDHEKMERLLKNGEILRTVEREIGKLK
ncbi:MAG: aromatic amino acid ammonia-lyase [Bradymonadales bacterium]